MSSKLAISVGQYSDKGRKPENEDFYGLIFPDEPLLASKGVVAAIADGISGSEAGKEASECAIGGFLNDYLSTPESWTVKRSVEKVLLALNQWLYSQNHHRFSGYHGMLTTFTAMVIKSTTAHIMHVGDTRIYRLREGEMELLTNDHRMWVSAEKNYLSRALGADLHLDIDYRTLAVEQGDAYLFSTDGVHEHIGDRRIQELIEKYRDDPDQACREIANTALHNGSTDNLTCQLVHIDSLPGDTEQDFYRKLTELPFPPDLEPGMILDGYRVIRELNASARSQIYLALDTDSGDNVVLKTPSVNYQDDPLYIDQFLHEEWIGRRMQNPHVMKVHEPHNKRRFLYYVAEHIEGRTLRQWIHDNRHPSMDEVRGLAQQIAAGLRAIHRMEMLHQDLKPENIMIDTHGTVKIIDFGSARIAGLEETASPISHDFILGTADYSAPEYIDGERGSNRSDIYSLGVIVYEMLSGHLPFGKTETKRPSRRRKKYISARNIRPDLPAWVDAALQKATQTEPRKRYALLSEFIHDLNRPNAALVDEDTPPLLERNPLAFWKGLSGLLFLVVLALLYQLMIN